MLKIRKPALGRVADSRLTAEFIASDPRFAGVTPFDPAVDVDIVDEMNNALAKVGTGGIDFCDDFAQIATVEQHTDNAGQSVTQGFVIQGVDGDGTPLPAGSFIRIAGFMEVK